MRLKYLFAVGLVCMGLTAAGHPLHLTFTNLEYNARKNNWTLTIKVFSDDFATNLKMATGAEPITGRNSGNGQTEQLLKKWLETRLLIWFDSRPVLSETWKFTGITVREDASWLNFTFSAGMPSSEIKIRNSLLMDLYGDQKNLFILTMEHFQSAHQFKIKDQETVIKLNK